MREALIFRQGGIGADALLLTTTELARLARSKHRMAGVAAKDLVELYQRAADMCGLAQRELARHQVDEQSEASHLFRQLQAIQVSIADCLRLSQTQPSHVSSDD